MSDIEPPFWYTLAAEVRMVRWGWLALLTLAGGCFYDGSPVQWGYGADIEPERAEDRWQSARIGGAVGSFDVDTRDAFGTAFLWERSHHIHANVIAEGPEGFVMGVLDVADVDVFGLDEGDTLLGGSGHFDLGPQHEEGRVHLQGCGTDTYGDWEQEDFGSEYVEVIVLENTGDTVKLGFEAVLEETGQVVEGQLGIRSW